VPGVGLIHAGFTIMKTFETTINKVKENQAEAWRWGIGGFVGVVLLFFGMRVFLILNSQYYDQFSNKITTTANERNESETKLANALDKLGDNIATQTEVDRQMLDRLTDVAKEQDDIGDEMRIQNTQFERFLNWADNTRKGNTSKPIFEEP